MKTITVVIVYLDQKYGLIIPSNATVRQLKNEIYQNIGIKIENQRLFHDKVALENDQSLANYGIATSSLIELYVDTAQDRMVTTQTELLEPHSWIDFIDSDIESAAKIKRDCDYIIDKIHELESKTYSINISDEIASNVRKCGSRVSKMEALCGELANKFSFLEKECTRFAGIICENKEKQVALLDKMPPVVQRNADNANSVDSAPVVEEQSQEKPIIRKEKDDVSVYEEYIQVLNNLMSIAPYSSYRASIEDIDKSSTDSSNDGENSLAMEKKQPKATIIRPSVYQEVESPKDEEDEKERMIIRNRMKEMVVMKKYNIQDEERKEYGTTNEYELMEHTTESAMRLLNEVRDVKDEYMALSCLDLSYCNIGYNGFTQLVDIFINNNSIMLKELNLAGNQIGPNQINYLINQLKLASRKRKTPGNKFGTYRVDDYIFPYLKKLNLNDNFIGNEGFKGLCLLFLYDIFPVLNQLFLFNNMITTDSLRYILQINLHDKNSINIVMLETQLALVNEEERKEMIEFEDRLDKSGASVVEINGPKSDICLQFYLIEMIRQIPKLEKIAIHDVNLSNSMFDMVIEYLRQYCLLGKADHLKSIVFDHCNLSDADVSVICDVIKLFISKKCYSFSFLGLDVNRITALGLKDIIQMCSQCRECGVSVDFSITHNPIGNDGLKLYMKEYFCFNKECQSSLSFLDCELTDSCFDLLVSFFEEEKKKGDVILKALNISENALTDESCSRIIKLFSTCPRLMNISIENTKLSSKSLYQIITYFIKNKRDHPIYMFLKGNMIDEEEANTLSAIVDGNFDDASVFVLR